MMDLREAIVFMERYHELQGAPGGSVYHATARETVLEAARNELRRQSHEGGNPE